MKKTLKRIIAICLVVTFAFSLSGCTMKEIKAGQAFWNEDGSITWQGSKYLYLEVNSEIDLDINFNNYIKVTEADVPVLLSEALGTKYYVIDDGKLIYNFEGLYCKEEFYDDVVSKITSDTEFTKYYYTNYGDDPDLWGTRYYLTDAETKVVENILSEAVRGEISHDEVWYTDDYCMISELYVSSKNGFYSKYLYDFIRTEEQFFLLSAEPLGSDEYNPTYHLYLVPEKYEEDLLDIFRYTDTEFYSYEESYDEIYF